MLLQSEEHRRTHSLCTEREGEGKAEEGDWFVCHAVAVTFGGWWFWCFHWDFFNFFLFFMNFEHFHYKSIFYIHIWNDSSRLSLSYPRNPNANFMITFLKQFSSSFLLYSPFCTNYPSENLNFCVSIWFYTIISYFLSNRYFWLNIPWKLGESDREHDVAS